MIKGQAFRIIYTSRNRGWLNIQLRLHLLVVPITVTYCLSVMQNLQQGSNLESGIEV